MEAISGDVVAMLGTPRDESSALDSKAMDAVDVRHVVCRPDVSKVASHGIVATSLIRGDGPSVGVMCGGLGCPCGASHGARDSLMAGRPRVSETRCVS